MKTVRVWAPFPKTVEVRVGHANLPMTLKGDGWWEADVSGADMGRGYGFIVDGQGPFPDPRSARQPNGVHGLSLLVDHNDFQWTDHGWQAPPLSSAIIYELHIGTFTPEGTFQAAIDKLDHLVGLGITHVELMPVVEFDGGRGWGYDGVDLFAPHHAYGAPSDLKKLVDACHARRLAVILDVVYNHLGPSGNYLAKYGPYFTTRYPVAWGAAINYDGPDSAEVRRFFCDNALMWLRDYHFDGLRLDAVHAIFDFSAQTFLEQLGLEVKALGAHLGRHFALIPESDLNDPRLLWPREHGGFGLDAQWSDDFHHALHTVLTGESKGYYSDFGALSDLAKALKQAFVYDGCFSKHRRRPHGRPPEGLSGQQFLAYLQNHDQVGNRADGKRSSGLMSPGLLKVGAAIVLMSPFVPMLFQGEEWGASTPFFYFTDYTEPALAKNVREGRCREFAAFGWKPEETADPQAYETFERSKLDWAECSRSAHASMLEWHRRLIQLRRAMPALADGRMGSVRVDYDETEHWLIFVRDSIVAACNLSASMNTVPLCEEPHRLLLASEPATAIGKNEIILAPESVAILQTDD